MYSSGVDLFSVEAKRESSANSNFSYFGVESTVSYLVEDFLRFLEDGKGVLLVEFFMGGNLVAGYLV